MIDQTEIQQSPLQQFESEFPKIFTKLVVFENVALGTDQKGDKKAEFNRGVADTFKILKEKGGLPVKTDNPHEQLLREELGNKHFDKLYKELQESMGKENGLDEWRQSIISAAESANIDLFNDLEQLSGESTEAYRFGASITHSFLVQTLAPKN